MSTKEDLSDAVRALRAVLGLIDDGVLVRDTSKDRDPMAFLRQGALITGVLKRAQDIVNQYK